MDFKDPKMRFERISHDEEEDALRKKTTTVELEAIRTSKTKTPPFQRSRTSSQTGVSEFNARPDASKRDPIPDFIEKHSWFICMFFVNLLYFYSLTSCDMSFKKCQKAYSSHIKYWAVALFAAAYIFVTVLLNTFATMAVGWAKLGKPRHKDSLFLFMTFFNYLFLCSLKEGLTWASHGTFSRIVFNSFIILVLAIRVYLAVSRCFKDSYLLWIKWAMILLLGLFGILFIRSRVLDTHNTYNDGFGNSKLVESPHFCRFHKFGLNYFSTFDEIFWKFAHSNSDCSSRRLELDWLDKLGDYDDKYVGYPLTTTLSNTQRQHFQLLQDHIINNMKIVDPKETDKSPSEAFIDFTEDAPKIRFNIKRNETLVANVKQIAKDNPSLLRPNVLFILIDSLSRQHFFRKLRKTTEYFNAHFFNHTSHAEGGMKGYQFFRYHSLADHAEPNLIALRYDDAKVTGEVESHDRIERYFKDQGWIISAASSKCEIEELDLKKDEKNKRYVDHHPMDHEFYSLACDPNSMPTRDPFGMFKGPFSEFRRCVYGTDAAAHQLNYSLEFWRKYKTEPKFQTLTLTDGHEITGELPYYLDEHLVSYFKTMKSEGLLNDSIVFLLSDNGNGGNFLFSGTDSGKNEAANPFLAVMMSKNNVDLFGHNLSENEQKLITPHDIFRALGELSHNFKEYIGDNFFTTILRDNRRCNDQDVQIDLDFCRCK